MRLRPEHFDVLAAMRMFGGAAMCEALARALRAQDQRSPDRHTDRRVFAALDQLQTVGFVTATWPAAAGPAVWALTKRGLECLTQTHH